MALATPDRWLQLNVIFTGVKQSTKEEYVTVQRLFTKESFEKKIIRSVKILDVKLFFHQDAIGRWKKL